MSAQVQHVYDLLLAFDSLQHCQKNTIYLLTKLVEKSQKSIKGKTAALVFKG